MKGVDISSYQVGVNYAAAAKEIDFVILRACWGENEDKMLRTHAQGFKEAGIPILGLYCFDYALCKSQAAAEADYIVDLARSLELPESAILFFDCEYDSVRWAKDNGLDLTAEKVQEHTRAFMDRVKESGYRTGYYTNLDWSNRYYKNFEKQPDELFWFARYGATPEIDYDILQYSADGTIPGIKGKVDLNEMKEKTMALKAINPNEWIDSHEGKIYDIDGAYGVQCVDLFKIFLKDIGYPAPTEPLGGDGYAHQIWYGRQKYSKYFDFVTGKLKKGDILIWPKGHHECPDSHVAMFVGDSPRGGNRGIFLGANQGYAHSPGVLTDISCSGSLGALRYKGFTDKSSTQPANKPIAENGTVRVLKGHEINLRAGGPKGRVVGQLKEGDELTYDHKVVTNGHRYVISGSLYLAITPTEKRENWWVDVKTR
ncbi:GH25 family lysozyme [Ileibacterium valens]|uniref:GH25 family lysozyme n=1 Tax=Ileibacterium valens TaxID=1862668 RepID=UPI0024BA0E72|nr:GH25 family lysozyme [Ileibacterium valens]